MKLPKTILPCPIVESTLEIRFQTNLPPDTMVGFVYTLIPQHFDLTLFISS